MKLPVKGKPKKEPAGTGDARRDRWSAHRSQRRAELVEATILAINEHGAGVGMDEIAAKAGITKPVLYRHFTDKSDLYLAVGQRASEILLGRIVPTLTASGTPREIIAGIIGAYLDTIEDYPELYQFMVRRSFADVETDPIYANESMVANLLSQLLGDFLAELGLDSGGAEPYSYAVVGAVQTAGAWWLDRRTMSKERLSHHLCTVLWHAIEGLTRSVGVTLDPDVPVENIGELTAAVRPTDIRRAR
ncbi:TetR/AcrR family transcriptional regulator [Pseudonocardiaceae bacterium YIM PH 21723]|nr:TetR/AcrR family transcriptional regulator [Pseudonocardiaceae bacterium YIM PH 21723]